MPDLNRSVLVESENADTLGGLTDVTITGLAASDFLKYNGTLWVNGPITLGTDTTGNYMSNVSAGNLISISHTPGEGSTATINVANGTAGQVPVANATGVPTYVTLFGDVTIAANGETTIASNAVALGTDTTGNYIATITGTANEITVTGSGSENAAVTLSLPANVTIANNLTVTGDLTVNGNTTTLNTANLNVEDNFVLLNSGVTGVPALNAGIEIERGDSTNVSIRWNETTDKWEFTTNGSTYSELGSGGATVSATAPSSPSTGSIWFDSDTGQTYVYYDSSWIEVGASSPARLTISASAPSNPIEGSMWFDSDDGATYTYYNGIWVEVGASAVDTLLTAIDAKGDLLVGTADNTVSKLTAGTDGYVLSANSSTATGLQWTQVSSNPLTSNAAAIFIMDIGA